MSNVNKNTYKNRNMFLKKCLESDQRLKRQKIEKKVKRKWYMLNFLKLLQ